MFSVFFSSKNQDIAIKKKSSLADKLYNTDTLYVSQTVQKNTLTVYINTYAYIG